jgi:hypothetical protein
MPSSVSQHEAAGIVARRLLGRNFRLLQHSAFRVGPTCFPALIRYNHGMAESFSARLANIVLPEAAGGDVRLGALWEREPAVVVFLRHYG